MRLVVSLVVSKCFVVVVAVCTAFVGFPSVAAADDTDQIQKEFEATKAASQVAQSTLQEAQAAAVATEKKLTQLKATIQSTKARAAELGKRQQILAAKLQDSQVADQLMKIADAAEVQSTQALAVRTKREQELQRLKQDLAMYSSKALQTGRIVKQNEAKIKTQQAAIVTAKAAKDAADKAALEPRKTVTDAAQQVAAKTAAAAKARTDAENVKQAIVGVQQAADSLKNVVETAKQAAAAAKGTTAEKATADSVIAQVEAARRVANVAEQLKKKVQPLDGLLKLTQTAQVAAEANLKTVTAAAKPQVDAAARADSGLAAANKVLADTQKFIADAKAKLAAASTSQQSFQTQVAALKPVVEKAVAEFEQLNAKTIELRKKGEEKLIAADRMVSFSNKVAPIFADRCLACHNARIAKGRYSMESFAAIQKGGESGSVIEHGSADDSYLFSLLVDGEMPQDAEPLTKNEIATIRKWINTGAVLNAGVEKNAKLIQITPTVDQPQPPEEYRVPMPVTAVAFSKDGKRLATSGYHEVLIWDATTGKQLQRVTNVAERVYDIEFSADGQTFAVAAGTPAKVGELKVFDNAGKLLANLIRTDDSVFAAAYSPDGLRLASAGADRTIRVFDVSTYQEQLRIEDHADWVMDIAWAPDGKQLASASRDKTAKVFDATTGDSIVTFNGHAQPVFGVGFLPDGKAVVTGGSDKQLRIWNVADAKETRKIGGFGNEVFRIHVTVDGFVYSSSADQTARQHQLSDGKETRKFSGHSDWVYSVAYSPATKRVATGSYDGEVRVWNSEDGKSLLNFVAIPGQNHEKTAAK